MAEQATTADRASQRLVSLDALRGFDMFWIVGGESIIVALATLTGWPVFDAIRGQLHHPEWNGFAFLDLVFPLFLFIAGVAMPYSLTRRLEAGYSKRRLYWRVIRRGVTLVLLGLIYQGLLKFDFATLRYPSVLGRIGLAYTFGALILLNTRWRGQAAWALGLLLGYWAAMKWIPVPGIGAGDWSPGNTLADFIDRNLLPGTLYRQIRDPEGIFSTVPAIATALLGGLTGNWIRNGPASGHIKSLGMFAVGLVFLSLGWFFNGWFPVNKNLWTSSFVLVTGGWSLMLLALFYWIIDVRGWRRWAFPVVVIGMNPITAYLADQFIGWQDMAAIIFAPAESLMHPAVFGCLGFLLLWFALFLLYRSRWFLRV